MIWCLSSSKANVWKRNEIENSGRVCWSMHSIMNSNKLQSSSFLTKADFSIFTRISYAKRTFKPEHCGRNILM